jgi:hypothetical protein|tara:strand:- start:1201 stop:1479 length:279 start_codon:yes stop_codon:yes gene_type:complete
MKEVILIGLTMLCFGFACFLVGTVIDDTELIECYEMLDEDCGLFIDEIARLQKQNSDLKKENTEMLKSLTECWRSAVKPPSIPGAPIGSPNE